MSMIWFLVAAGALPGTYLVAGVAATAYFHAKARYTRRLVNTLTHEGSNNR
jgi:hypothetical protein